MKLLYSDVASLSNPIWTVGLNPGGGHAEQLAAMLAWLGVDWKETLSLNLVPFRSARWDSMSLAWRRSSLAFAQDDFWPLLLKHRRPRLVISFGVDPAQTLRQLLGHGAPTTFPVGWGNVTADVTSGASDAVLRLPHLSRFGIFGRPGGTGAKALAALRDAPALRRVLVPRASTSPRCSMRSGL